MHMGSLAIAGLMEQLDNYKHIVLNNGAHDSVGGQPTVGYEIDFVKIAQACGYTLALRASEESEIREKLQSVMAHKGRAFLEIQVNKGARKDLGRPTRTPKENKASFQRFLQ